MARPGAQTIHNHADYRLMSRRALERVQRYREINLCRRGTIPLIGLRSAVVDYERSARFAGWSKYPPSKMLALDAITSFSVFPLRLISLLGFVVFVAAMVVSAWALWAASFTDTVVPGWTSVVLPMYFLGRVQLLALGVIGEYLCKVYVETKSRPQFFIQQALGGSHEVPSVAMTGPATYNAPAPRE